LRFDVLQICVSRNSISFAVGIVFGLLLISVGVTAIIAPKFASAMFGVAAADNSALAYVYATGMRDVTIGCLLAVLAFHRAGPRILGATLLVLALIPIVDAIIVWMNAAKPSAIALALHISGAITFLALGFWFRSGRFSDSRR
jgi:hypothetical protein